MVEAAYKDRSVVGGHIYLKLVLSSDIAEDDQSEFSGIDNVRINSCEAEIEDGT